MIHRHKQKFFKRGSSAATVLAAISSLRGGMIWTWQNGHRGIDVYRYYPPRFFDIHYSNQAFGSTMASPPQLPPPAWTQVLSMFTNAKHDPFNRTLFMLFRPTNSGQAQIYSKQSPSNPLTMTSHQLKPTTLWLDSPTWQRILLSFNWCPSLPAWWTCAASDCWCTT